MIEKEAKYFCLFCLIQSSSEGKICTPFQEEFQLRTHRFFDVGIDSSTSRVSRLN